MYQYYHRGVLMRLIFGVDKTPTMSFPLPYNLAAAKYPRPQLFLLAGSIIENVGTFTVNSAESAVLQMFQKIKIQNIRQKKIKIQNVFNLKLSSEGRVVSYSPEKKGELLADDHAYQDSQSHKIQKQIGSNSKKFLSSQKKKKKKKDSKKFPRLQNRSQVVFIHQNRECKCLCRDSLTIIVPFNIA